MAIFDKSTVNQDVRQYATRIKSGDVAKYVLLPGDPDRVDRIASYLDDVELVASNREFKTITGIYRELVLCPLVLDVHRHQLLSKNSQMLAVLILYELVALQLCNQRSTQETL